MRQRKILILLAGVLAGMLVFAASASATTLTEAIGVKASKLHANNENGFIKMTNNIAAIECNSTLAANITSQGGEENPVVGNVEAWTFTGCQNNWKVTTVKTGTWALDYKAAFEGTWTSTGLEIQATRFATQCVYVTAGTDIGTFTDSFKTGGTATLDVNASVALDMEKSSGLCGTKPGTVTGSYLFDTPDHLEIDKN